MGSDKEGKRWIKPTKKRDWGRKERIGNACIERGIVKVSVREPKNIIRKTGRNFYK